jgi:outer membrane protein OmpA-like peptidoglycan-associated protein
MRYLLALLLLESVAHAQVAPGDTFNLQLFRPAMDSKGYFTVDASQPLGHLDWSIGLTGTYAHDELELHSDTHNFRVSDQITSQLQGALGLFGRAEVGVSLPVHILFGNRDDQTFGAQMVGDLGVHAKVRLLDGGRRPLGLALSTALYLPTGPSHDLLGEGNVSLRPQLILDGEFGKSRRFRAGLNAGALVRFARNGFTDPGTGKTRALGTQLTYGLGISGAVVPQRFELLAELYGYADLTGHDPDGNHAVPLEWLAGGKVYLASKSYFQFGAGTGIIPDQTGSPEVRAFIGFIYEPPVPPRAQGEVVAPPEPRREPPPPSDRDGDGIPDTLDKCPDEPEDFDGFEDDDGCPDPDNDKDGIPDIDDLCPNEPETFNGYEDKDGCPDTVPEPPKKRTAVRRGRIDIFEKIHFETAKATIKPESFPTLDAVAGELTRHEQIKLLEVQGHADERGDDDYNLQLTEDRAQAVKRYLIEHGVDAARLTAHGYGETRPLCRKHSEACWSKNRRVEFVILRQEGDIPGQD